MPLTRRELLGGGLTVGLATTLSGCLGESVGASMDGVFETPDPNAMEQELDDGFDRLVWQPDGSAEVFFEETHGMDGFYIAHESDRPEDAIASCDVPRYGGSTTAPLLALLREDGYSYPTRRFKFIGGRGSFAKCSNFASVSYLAIYDPLGTAYFTVPERFDL